MKKIESFTIDHLTLMPGVYVSRRDTTPSGDHLTTFDVRLTAPNREPAVSPEALHTIEHLAATYLRNHPQWAPSVVYWGPMGCCTGSYLILQGELMPEDVLPLLRETFGFVAGFEGEIPGATAKDCGNYLFNDLPEARRVARRFLDDVLVPMPEGRFRY
ncbi:MAG: S-ribosylhomocysteine lyase [Muribaculaceae bacterium]|nr:S-ribosylhomocysteine lyase [Muribaculaceae bacterium]